MTTVAHAMKARVGSYFVVRRLAGAVHPFATNTRRLLQFRLHRVSGGKDTPAQTWRVPIAVRREFFQTPLSLGISNFETGIPLNIGAISPLGASSYSRSWPRSCIAKATLPNCTSIGAADFAPWAWSRFFRSIEAAERSGFARYVGSSRFQSRSLPPTLRRLSSMSHLMKHSDCVVAEAPARNLEFFGDQNCRPHRYRQWS